MKYQVCLDGSDCSQKALEKVLPLLRDEDEVILYAAFQSPNIFYNNDFEDAILKLPVSQEIWEKELNTMKENAIKLLMEAKTFVLKKKDFKTEPVIVVESTQDIREAIIKYAEHNGVNFVVVGTRGLGTVKRLVLGSVSSYVVHNVPQNCCVIVAR